MEIKELSKTLGFTPQQTSSFLLQEFDTELDFTKAIEYVKVYCVNSVMCDISLHMFVSYTIYVEISVLKMFVGKNSEGFNIRCSQAPTNIRPRENKCMRKNFAS